ncbi:MAG: hypothetical protein Q9191_001548 [Dirinaria sp. TL-2023a]
MAYPYENAHTRDGHLPHQYVSNGARKSYDQTYANGISSSHIAFENKHVDLIRTPTNGVNPRSQPDVQPKVSQSVQVVIPSPKNTPRHQSIKTAARPVEPVRTNPTQLSVEHQLLLVSLAEDYFAAAYAGGSKVAWMKRRSDAQTYHKLIATGLGCLEAVLKYWRLQPLLEARIRLRYATVLYDETENFMEAEEALSKGISICDRLRNFDLKYNMQHLLARVLHRRNNQASLKYIDRVIGDIEAYQHVAWVYAFRFLRVSLCLESSLRQDVLSALGQLRFIVSVSERHGDGAISALASILEALCYVRMSSSAETLEQAQRALAAARSLQFDSAVAEISQLATMTNFVDLCCTLQYLDPAKAVPKLQAMQTTLEAVHTNSSSSETGNFLVPINHTQASQDKSCKGIIQDGTNGHQGLLFNWMPKEYIYNFGYLLSGICTAHKNPLDGQRSEHMLNEGLRKQEMNIRAAEELAQSATVAASQLSWWQSLKCYMQLHLAFALCARTAWSAASDRLRLLKEDMNAMQGDVPADLRVIVIYLEALIYQGTGRLDPALRIFQSPTFSLPHPNKPAPSKHCLDMSILAALNSLLIIRSRTPTSPEVALLIDRLGPLCAENTNKALMSAYNLILAIAPSAETIVRTKQCLQNALQAAKVVANNQLMCMTLNLMSWKFFRGVVGQQAEKSARASQSLANKGKDTLWMSVSAGLLGDTLEIQGRVSEADAVRAEGRKIAGALPELVQRVQTDGLRT